MVVHDLQARIYKRISDMVCPACALNRGEAPVSSCRYSMTSKEKYRGPVP